MKTKYIWGILLWVLCLGVPVASAQRVELSHEQINKIAESVVYIETLDRFGNVLASGSGTIVNETGLIYTNRHVIEDGVDFHIFLIEDMQEMPVPRYYASIISFYEELDFAVLQIDRDNQKRAIDPATLTLPAVQAITDSQVVNYGDAIYIFGYPDIGDGYLALTQGAITTIENGTIAGQRLPIWYRTDAVMSSGNSGGLVVNDEGLFLGIPTWVRKADTTMGQLGGILPLVAIEATIAINDGNTGFPQSEDFAGEYEDDDEYGDYTGEYAEFVIENASESDVICYLFFSPSTSTEWGTDYLDTDEVIEPGDVVYFDVEVGTYDLMLQDCDRETLDDQRRLVLEDTLYLTYTDLGIEDAPVFTQEQDLYVEATAIEHDVVLDGDTILGMKVYAYIRATGYRNEPLRVAIFYYWGDDTPMSGAAALPANRTTSGYLTIQEIIEPEYDDTEWDGYWFWMPYSAFPDVPTGKQEAYAEVQIGLEDGEFVSYSNPLYFTLIEE